MADRAAIQGTIPPEFAIVTTSPDTGEPPIIEVRSTGEGEVEMQGGLIVDPPVGHQFVWVQATVTNGRDVPLDWSAAAIAELGEDRECVEVRWLPDGDDGLRPVADSVTPWGPFVDDRVPPYSAAAGHLLFACRGGQGAGSQRMRVFYGYADSKGAIEVWHRADLVAESIAMEESDP